MNQWMTTKQVADESGRHSESILLALRKGTLKGVQPAANCIWRVSRREFDRWASLGFPLPRVDRAAS